MQKNLQYGALLALYGGLLTEKQAEAMEYYYDDDLSLGEIAENMHITRQGVRDFIKRGESVLQETEEKLRLFERLRSVDVIRASAEDILYLNKRLADSRHIRELAERILAAADSIENGENVDGV